MMIIMLGSKKEQIDCRHRLVKPRVQRRRCQLRIVKLFETENNSPTYLSKCCEDLFKSPRIMVRLISRAVAKIRRAQFGSAGERSGGQPARGGARLSGCDRGDNFNGRGGKPRQIGAKWGSWVYNADRLGTQNGNP
jgi:hypothetical protein